MTPEHRHEIEDVFDGRGQDTRGEGQRGDRYVFVKRREIPSQRATAQV
jgi:hypothetical protein